MPRPSRIAAAALAAALVSACSSVASPPQRELVVRGPLPTRIQHPLALIQPGFTPRSVRTQAPGEWRVEGELAYSSIFERSAAAGARVAFDAELLRSSLRARRGLAPGIDLEVALGGVYGSSGFLDQFIEEFHDLIGAPNQGRDKFPQDRFESVIEVDGQTAWSWRDDRAQLGDTLLVLTFGESELEREQWGNAWRLGLELPTGDEQQGSGNGGVDWLVGWSGEISFDTTTHFAAASAGQARTTTTLARAGLDLPERLELFYGLEWRWGAHWSWVFQLDLHSPLLDEIELSEIDRPILDLGVGFVRDAGADSRWWFSFHEDLLADSGPDFALFLGWMWGV